MKQQSDNTVPGCAIITGANGGLGTSFALECASRGFNLILVDLPNRGLPKLAAFVERNFSVNAIAHEADITTPHSGELLAAALAATGWPLKLLIQNAGINQNELFEDASEGYMCTMIDVNCKAIVSLTSALLPALKAASPSHIITVSSLGSFYILPRKSCYAATKGFVRQFAQALRLELQPHGISVSILCPGAMTTNIANYRLHKQLNWFSRKTLVHPHAVAAYSIQQAFRKKELIVPGRLARIIKMIGSLIPVGVQKKLAAYSMKQLEIHGANTGPANQPPMATRGVTYISKKKMEVA